MKDLENSSEATNEELLKRVQGASNRSRDVQRQNSNLLAELDKMKNENRDLVRELESTRADASGMLKVMQNMETTIAEFTSRETAASDLQKQSAEKVRYACVSVISTRTHLYAYLGGTHAA